MTVSETENLLKVLIPASAVLLALFVSFYFYRRYKNSKIGKLRLENSILRLKELPRNLDLYQVYEIFLDIKKYKKEMFYEFANQAEQIISSNIIIQESFLEVEKYFAGWASYKDEPSMLILHQKIVDTTKDHVRNLGSEYFESLKDLDHRARITTFEKSISKPFYKIGYELDQYFFRQIDEIETFLKQRNSHI